MKDFHTSVVGKNPVVQSKYLPPIVPKTVNSKMPNKEDKDAYFLNANEFAKRSQTPVKISSLLYGPWKDIKSTTEIGIKYEDQIDSDVEKVGKLDKFYSEFYKSRDAI